MHRFGRRLMKLQTPLNAVTAARHAALACEQHAGEVQPEEAAMMFATGETRVVMSRTQRRRQSETI